MLLEQKTLDCESFWQGKKVILPNYDRKRLKVKSLCFSPGRIAYGHTGDIMQDVLNENPDAGMMVGIETYNPRYCLDLAASDYLLTQLIFGDEKGDIVPKIQGAIKSVLFVDADINSLTYNKLMEYAHNPDLQFATINAPESVYGVVYSGGEFAEPVSDVLKQDMEAGTVLSDPAKWTAFARERFVAGLPFALVSCTNFSANGHVTGATLRTIASSWESKNLAPKGFVAYLSDPLRFSFPNCMIDRIAVPPDNRAERVMDELDLKSKVIVTEKTRYWIVEDHFPGGRPDFDRAAGVIMEDSYEEVKKYEDMKLRILNMGHSVIAGIGILLGYRGTYGICRAMQDKDIHEIIDRISRIVIETIDHPGKMSPCDFATETIKRFNNPNIPDDPMRIALNGSTKMLPRFMETYYLGQAKGMSPEKLDVVLLPVAGFCRYTMGIDDMGERFELENDPIRETLISCGQKATLGNPASARAFAELVSRRDIMGKDLLAYGDTGERMLSMVAQMMTGCGAVRQTLQKYL